MRDDIKNAKMYMNPYTNFVQSGLDWFMDFDSGLITQAVIDELAECEWISKKQEWACI